MKVSLADKREFEAEIVLKDPRTDLAVLRLKDARERFPALEFGDSDALQVGDVVLAIGNPFGVGQTVTTASSRRWRARRSASPTISSSSRPTRRSIRAIPAARWSIITGRLVGINTAIFSRSGGSQGIGFAIPANMVQGRGRLGQERRQRGASGRGSAPSCRR